MRSNNYSVKIIILFVATFIGLFAIWYALVREESVDWITSRVVRQVSPYAVAASDDGEVIIDNVVIGYYFSLPPGFKTTGARNLTFYLEEDGRKKCEIRHYYNRAGKGKSATATAEKIVIPLKEIELIFELAGAGTEKTDCARYLEQIKADLIAD